MARQHTTLILALCVAGALALCGTQGPHADLPSPPSTMEILTKDTWVIPMDRAQGTSFNLATYGYIFYLLWAGQPVRWVIKGCKELNDPDFSASVRQILPKYGSVTTRAFKYGAFVVNAPGDALGTYTRFVKRSGVIPPVVFRVEEDVEEVEVRHTWKSKPKMGVLGTENPDIHASIYAAAGLTRGKHYELMTQQQELKMDEKSCYTFVSNPHDRLKDWPGRVSHVHRFTQSGGNFFAQCHAAVSYSAQINRYDGKRFLYNVPDAGKSCGGCTSGRCDGGICSQVKSGGKIGSGSIQHPDLPVMQFDQSIGFNYGQGGSWSEGDVAFAKRHMSKRAYLELSDDTTFKSAGGTITGYDDTQTQGGMVFQLGGHQYKCDGNSLNGKRMLLNAALVPATGRPENCGLSLATKSPTTASPTPHPTTSPTTLSPTMAPTKERIHQRRLMASSGVLEEDVFKCLDGAAPRSCDYLTACSAVPGHLNAGSISAQQLSCFPDYCGDCKAVWANIAPKRASASGCSGGGKGGGGKKGKFEVGKFEVGVGVNGSSRLFGFPCLFLALFAAILIPKLS